MKPAVILFLSLWCLSLFGDEIQGFWKNFNQKTGHPGIIVAIYPYEGKYYGRILGSYDNEGVLDDTIYLPQGMSSTCVKPKSLQYSANSWASSR